MTSSYTSPRPLMIATSVVVAVLGGMSLGYLMSPLRGDLSPVINQLSAPSPVQPPKEWFHSLSEAGAYLIAQRAESTSDWPATHLALRQLSGMTDLPSEQNARFFLSSIASADWITAQKIITDHPDDIKNGAPLVKMLYAILAWSEGDHKAAQDAIDDVDHSPISQSLAPFAKGWMTGETPVLNIISAAQDIGFSTVNMVRFFEATKQYDKSDALMRKLQEADLNVRLRIWSIAYFARRGLTQDADKAQAALDDITRHLPEESWANEQKSVLAEAAGHLQNNRRALSLALIDATEFLQANNASAIALLYTQLAIKLSPDLYGADVLLASLYDAQGNWREALDSYAALAPDHPFYLQAQLRSASIMAEQDDLKAAEKKFLTLLRDNPKDPEVSFQYGEFLRIYKKDYRAAIDAFDTVDDLLGGKIPEAFWTLYLARGMSYEMLRETKKAQYDYQSAFRLQPINPEALNTLAYSWADQGIHLNEARLMLERALMLNPTAPHIIDSYGWVLFKLGRNNDALLYLERAAMMLPYDMTVNDHLGEVYWALGRKREAQFMWMRALQDENADPALLKKIRAKLGRKI